MDWLTQSVATLIAVPVAAVLGLGTYAFQRARDRKDALVALRRETYANLLGALQRQLQQPLNAATGTEIERARTVLEEMGVARARAFLNATDDVAVAMAEFFELSGARYESLTSDGTPGPTDGEITDAYAHMILKMRDDCFGKTDLTPKQVADLSPLRSRPSKS
jgi:hypothetical protein